jgi:GTPase SAR1 family protein
MEQNTLIKVNPQADVEVMNFYAEALKLLDYANARVIATAEDTKLAINDLSIIAKLKKAMEGKRKDYLLLSLPVKEINEAYKNLMLPIEQADKVTRDKVSAYMQEQARIRAEQEEINRLRLEAAQKEAALHWNGEISEPVNLVEVIDVQKKVNTDMGSIGTMKIWKWVIEDITKVPVEYLMVDGARLTRVIKAGVREIPGIHIFSEDTLIVKAKG